MAKDRTLRDRVESLELDIVSLRSDASSARCRITALEMEQAQRTAEKPATEKRAGPWVSAGFMTYAQRHTAKGMLVCTVEPFSAWWRWRAWAVSHDVAATHLWGTQYATEALARAACDAELVRLGWTLDEPPAPAPSEEDRLRDAVVDAALAWGVSRMLDHDDAVDKLAAACRALRAHRAKKGAI